MARATTKSTKATKSTKKATAKRPTNGGAHTLYAVPINEAAASGDLRQMKSMAAKARKHLADVQKALTKLEQSIAKVSG